MGDEALIRPELKQVVSELGNIRATDAGHAKRRLGWEPRSAEETVLATARSLIERGIVKV